MSIDENILLREYKVTQKWENIIIATYVFKNGLYPKYKNNLYKSERTKNLKEELTKVFYKHFTEAYYIAISHTNKCLSEINSSIKNTYSRFSI